MQLVLVLILFWMLSGKKRINRYNNKYSSAFQNSTGNHNEFEFSHKLNSEEFIKEAERNGIRKGDFYFLAGENDQFSGCMHLNAQRADNWVICEYRNKETNLRIEEAIKIGEFFFVLFDPNDFIMLLRNTFSTYPFLRGFNEEEYGLVSEVFRKAKQNAGNLVNWLYDGAEIRNAEKYVPKKRIRLFDSDHFIKNFFPEFASEDERYIIFKTNPYLWQGDEKTLLIKTSADDFF